MIGGANFFFIHPHLGNFKVVIARIRTIEIASNNFLKSILHVPKLSCNHLSISKLPKDMDCIVKDMDCIVKFSHDLCEFQDLHLGKRIGNARKHKGL